MNPISKIACGCMLTSATGLAIPQLDTQNLDFEFSAALDPLEDALWTDSVSGSLNLNFVSTPSRQTIASTTYHAIDSAYQDSATGLANYFESGTPHHSRLDATFEVWVEITDIAAGNDQVLFEAGGSSRGISFTLSNAQLAFNVDGDLSNDFTITENLNTGVHHIIGVIECEDDGLANDSIALYIDGTQIQTISNIQVDDWSGGNLAGLGAPGSSVTGVTSAQTFSGKIASLRYYANRAFSTADATLAADYYRDVLSFRIPGIGNSSNTDKTSSTGFRPTRVKYDSVSSTYYGFNFVRSDGTDGLVDGQFKSLDMYTSPDDSTWTFVETKLDHIDLPDTRLRSRQFAQTTDGHFAFYCKRHTATAALRHLIIIHSDTIDGDYTITYDDFPFGYSSGDLGMIVSNNRLHIISAATLEGRINIYRTSIKGDQLDQLTNSLHWTHPDGSEDHREAPSLFSQNGYYFLTTSGKTGWQPNQQKYSYASSLDGAWSSLIDMGDPTGFHSQLFSNSRVVGTLETSRIFSSTRNSPAWGGEGGSRPVHLPMYFNTDTEIAINYYDEVLVNETTGVVEGFHYDHGRELKVSSISLHGHADDISAIIDGDESTSWENGNDASKKEIRWDLGSAQTVKALKLMPINPENRSMTVDIYVGDGSNWTHVFPTPVSPPVIPMLTWLGPLDVVDAQGRYVRMVLDQTYNNGNPGTGVVNLIGFYETEIWGETSNAGFEFEEIFDGQSDGVLPAGWSALENDPGASASIASVPSSSDKSVRIHDSVSNGRIRIEKTYTRQKGSLVVLEADFRMDAVGSGEYIRIYDGGAIAFDLVNSGTTGGLSETNNNWNHKRLADPPTGAWQHLRLEINTDLDTYDLYIDNDLVWGGGKLRNEVTGLDKVMIGTSNPSTGANAYFDNVTVDGPMP